MSEILKETLGVYPEFLKIVSKIALDEIDVNKEKATEYVNVQIDIHKRFVNCEHVEFTKMTAGLKKSQTKNLFDLWFKEKIPNAQENSTTVDGDDSDSLDSFNDAVDVQAHVSAPSKVIRKARGFFERSQRRESDDSKVLSCFM